jgi:hypothetical protein
MEQLDRKEYRAKKVRKEILGQRDYRVSRVRKENKEFKEYPDLLEPQRK